MNRPGGVHLIAGPNDFTLYRSAGFFVEGL